MTDMTRPTQTHHYNQFPLTNEITTNVLLIAWCLTEKCDRFLSRYSFGKIRRWASRLNSLCKKLKALWAPVQEGVKVFFFKYSLDWQWWFLEGLIYSRRYATIMVAMIWMFIHHYPMLAQRVTGHYGNVLRISMWIFTVDCEKLQHIVDIAKTPFCKNHKLVLKPWNPH